MCAATRVALTKETDEGMIENVYRLQLINKDAGRIATLSARRASPACRYGRAREIAAAPLQTVDIHGQPYMPNPSN